MHRKLWEWHKSLLAGCQKPLVVFFHKSFVSTQDLQNDTETFGFVDSDFVPTAFASSSTAVAEQRKLRKERSDSLKENNVAAQTSIPTAIFATSVIASAAIPIISKSPEPSEDNGVRFLPPDTENSLLVSAFFRQTATSA